MTKKLTDNLPLLTVVLIYFGYCNLYYYYKEFNIDIYNYISNSEIFLSFLPIIVVITALIGTSFISYIIGVHTGERNALNRILNSENESLVKVNNKVISFLKSPIFIVSILLLTSYLISNILINYFDYKRYELKHYHLVVSFLFPIFFYFILLKLGGPDLLVKNSFLLMLSFIIFIGSQIGSFNKSIAQEVKVGISSMNLSFNYNGNQITTDSTLILIGQTQSTLFLFNKAENSTQIYKREKVDSLIIK